MKIGLKDAIAALRVELSESILASQSEDIRFEVGEITMEFQIQIEEAKDVSGKVNIWVLDIGAGGSQSMTNTHTVRIPLRPMDSQRNPILTGNSIIPD